MLVRGDVDKIETHSCRLQVGQIRWGKLIGSSWNINKFATVIGDLVQRMPVLRDNTLDNALALSNDRVKH